MTGGSGGAGVLDTSTVILLPRIADPERLPERPSNEWERAARQAVLQQAEADFVPLPFDADAARGFGRVAASLRHAGRKLQARTHDAMTAAVAVSRGLPVHTCNPRDLIGIGDLVVVPVPHPDQPA